VSTEANLSSHLTISYSGAPTASGTTPGAANATGVPAAGSADFLSALIDQLLAGSATTLAGSPATGTAPATGAATTTAATTALAPAAAQSPAIPALLGLGVDADTAAAIAANPKATELLAKLSDEIRSIKDEIDQGKQPGKDQLKDLGDTVDALVAMLAAPAPAAALAAAPAPDLTQTLDPLAATGQSSSKTKTGDLAGLGADQTPAPATPTDQAQQYLASLGVPLSPLPQLDAPAVTAAAAPDTTVGAIAPTTPQQPLPAIAELAAKLADLSQALAPASPDLAKKLTALSDKLQAAEADPTTLAQLTTPADSSGTALDKLVRELLGARPAVQPAAANTPAAPTTLSVTDAVAPAATPTIATTPAATTTSAVTKLALSSKPAASPKDDSTADAKIVATAAAAADTPADKPAATDPATANTAAAAPVVAAPRAIPAAYQAVANPINMNQVAFEMVRQLHQGQSRFTLRIDPPELGRVDVKMHVDASGNVNARLTVERSETLDMFQRDKGALEKALTQAGLDSGKTNLEFSLRQNPFAGMTGGDQRPSGNNGGASFALTGTDTTDDAASVPSVVLYSGVASTGGLNLFV
jgi:flagellar hook-length control protein FliK